MEYTERLSIIMTSEQLENLVANCGSHKLNSYGLNQAKEALSYYTEDFNLMQRIMHSRSANKFDDLFNNRGSQVNRYHSPRYAAGALASIVFFFNRGNIKQADRILHRSNLFKIWSKLPDERNRWGLSTWDQPYSETLPNCSSKAITKGQHELERLKQLQQPIKEAI